MRLSDVAPRVGETKTIQGRTWLVAERLPRNGPEAQRFRLRPADPAES